MLKVEQIENFRKDYFYGWEIRKLFVRLFKECYRYDGKRKTIHTFDNDGYIASEKRFIGLDEIINKYDDAHIKEIAESLKKMLGTQTNTTEKKLWKELWYDTLDGRFPHVHWAYFCVNNGKWDADRREVYYNSMIAKTSLHGRDMWTSVEYPKIYKRQWKDSNDIIQKAEEVLRLYGESLENLIPSKTRKKIVFFTGSGVSQESGIPTFRDTNGLWEQYPVDSVATHTGWVENPEFVNKFYNELREKYFQDEIQVNDAHILISYLEACRYEDLNAIVGQNIAPPNADIRDYEVTVITQNVDTLHERAGSGRVVHLHGRLDIICGAHNVDDTRFHIHLPFNEKEDKRYKKIHGYTIDTNTRLGDAFDNLDDTLRFQRMRPYIVFFGESVPKMADAIKYVEEADVLVIIGTSLQVYPAASLLEYANYDTPIIYIDPNPSGTSGHKVKVIKNIASEGMKELLKNWTEYTNLL